MNTFRNMNKHICIVFCGYFTMLLIIFFSFFFLGDGCGYTVLGHNSGTLSSINYPQTYPNNTVCEWEIRVGAGEQILFKFGDFDIEDSNSCHFNYLRIYDNIGPGRKEIDLVTCLDKGSHFSEPEFSKFCPAGCLTTFGEISGTIPDGYRDSSLLCMAGIHAGVVSNLLGGQINVVSSKGIPYYESALANNVTSVGMNTGSFFFCLVGCYGTLGLESGVVRNSQITSSSFLQWDDLIGHQTVWGPERARLRKPGPSWAALNSDGNQWLQIDLKKERKVTGIITTGSTVPDYYFYVSAYRVLYSEDGETWKTFMEASSEQDKIFQGNVNYFQEVRNNFIPPIEARYIRINPVQWHQKIALKLELLGCLPFLGRAPFHPPPSKLGTDFPVQLDQTTFTPEIRNTTVTPSGTKDITLGAVLVPVLVMTLTILILIIVCTWHWKSRKKTAEGTYDIPYWDRTGWWKGMKHFLPAKGSEGEECQIRYSSSEVSHLGAREVGPILQTEPAEYAQPLVSGLVGTLRQRSTFKPEDSIDHDYSDPDPYDAPLQGIYHAYAEPLPATGPEYATPIIMDVSSHLPGTLPHTSISTFKSLGTTVSTRADNNVSSVQEQYDTPKGIPGPVEVDLLYKVPQNSV
uniref:Discoidin, CUB and LCCL domain containing 2 n=1 Tax=Erpetoichthys calabaricus TaxID=27687 RepID=A0A8C4SJ61_ERPCA